MPDTDDRPPPRHAICSVQTPPNNDQGLARQLQERIRMPFSTPPIQENLGTGIIKTGLAIKSDAFKGVSFDG